MREPDADRLVGLALEEHISPRLLEAVAEHLAREAGAAGAAVRRGGREVARWGDAGRSPRRLDLGGAGWEAYLAGGETPAAGTLRLVRLLLRVWELREELRGSRLGERLRLWELEALRGLASGIAGVLDPAALGDEVVARLASLLGVRRAQLVVGEGPAAARTVARFGDEVVAGAELARAWEEGLVGPDRIALPVRAPGGTVGVIAVADKEGRTGTVPFAQDDRRLVELFSVLVAVAVVNARLYRESLERERLRAELEVAAEIQEQLYPQRVAAVEGYAVGLEYRPSREVSGDCFEVLRRGSGLLAMVADVSGKGVGAGLLAGALHAGVHLLVELEEPPEALLGRLNRYLVGVTQPNRFATVVLAELEPDGTAAVANAGHCPPLLVRAAGRVERIASTGVPVGVLPGARWSAWRGRLDPGDLLLLYTDGVTEASRDGEEFGLERLEAVARRAAAGGPTAVAAAVLEAVRDHAGEVAREDDTTVLAVQRTPGG